MGQHRNRPAHRQALPKPEKSGFHGDRGTNRFHEVRGGIARVAITAIMEISCLVFPSLKYNKTRTTVLGGMSKLRYVVCRLHQYFHLRAPLGQYLLVVPTGGWEEAGNLISTRHDVEQNFQVERDMARGGHQKSCTCRDSCARNRITPRLKRVPGQCA